MHEENIKSTSHPQYTQGTYATTADPDAAPLFIENVFFETHEKLGVLKNRSTLPDMSKKSKNTFEIIKTLGHHVSKFESR